MNDSLARPWVVDKPLFWRAGYGASITDRACQIGICTGSILKGAAASELPVMQATKVEFVINLQTAKTLRIDTSPMLLARASDAID